MSNNHCVNKRSSKIVASRDSLDVIDCKSCGYAHLSEFPSEEVLSRFYQSEFWQKEKAGAVIAMERQREWLDATYGDWLELVERHTRKRDILDVGCGYGFFMEAADVRGWSAWGIDPNAESIKYARNLIGSSSTTTQCSWEDMDIPSIADDYGCISALWIIEHLHSPDKFLKWCYELLSPGGVLLAAVPSEMTRAQRLASDKASVSNYWIHHTHLNYFTQKSFSNLLGRCGFRAVEWSATYPMENFILDGDDYTSDGQIGAKTHKIVERIDLRMSREERIDEYQSLAMDGIGRDIICVAVKES